MTLTRFLKDARTGVDWKSSFLLKRDGVYRLHACKRILLKEPTLIQAFEIRYKVGKSIFIGQDDKAGRRFYIQNDGIRTVTPEHMKTVLSGGIVPACSMTVW